MQLPPIIAQAFEIEPAYVIWQLLSFIVFLIPVIMAIRATLVCAKSFREFLAPAWIIMCWILPVIGPIAATIAAKKYASENPAPKSVA